MVLVKTSPSNQVRQLVHMIDMFSLDSNKDKWICGLNSNGLFMVEACRSCLRSSNSDSTSYTFA